MKKSLIALAVAGTLVAPAAMADTSNVNVYGEINMSLDMVKSGDTSAAPSGGSVSANQVNSNESHIGFKGSEDLGGGVSAIFQVERGIEADSSDAHLEARNTFAGLKSDAAGSLTLGNQDTPYKTSTRRLDLFADGIADNRSLMGGAGLADYRATDSINYMSPSWGGFSVAAAYAMGAEDASNTTDTKGKGIFLAGMYNNGPIYATVAHGTIDFGSAGGQFFLGGDASAKITKVGGSYSTDMFAVNLVYETLQFEIPAWPWEIETSNLYLAGQYNITGNDAIKLAYTRADDLEETPAGFFFPTTDTGATQISLGYDHSLSKRTSVYALYTKLSNDQWGAYSLSGASSNGPSGPSDLDANPSAFSFGMKHSF